MPATIKQKMRTMTESAIRSVANWKIDGMKVDPRIQYPCYKSMDEFIDVERLKALDGYITERIQTNYRNKHDEVFYTGYLTIEKKSDQLPGSRIINLSQPIRKLKYLELNQPELWEPAHGASEFPLLMDFIATLPFKATGRMIIMFDNGGKPVTAHRDHARIDICHEFIWFRTNLNKPFYMLNNKTKEKKYVKSYSAWFDTVNQYHGADGHEKLSLSIRVDGTFTDEFRKKFPVVPKNPAAAPALWACTASQ